MHSKLCAAVGVVFTLWHASVSMTVAAAATPLSSTPGTTTTTEDTQPSVVSLGATLSSLLNNGAVPSAISSLAPSTLLPQSTDEQIPSSSLSSVASTTVSATSSGISSGETSGLETASTSFNASSTPTSAEPSSAPSSVPTSDPVIALMRDRRLTLIVGGVLSPVLTAAVPPTDIAKWLGTLNSSGKWPDSEVNYATGCAAQRANWPAQWHWQRILVMSAAWHGGLVWDDVDQWVDNADLRASIESAMDWWFERDFTLLDCLVEGGTTACPCGTTGLWNTNWYSNVILIPNILAQVCLLLDKPSAPLTPEQIGNCTRIVLRAYGTFDHGYGFSVGANTLDISKGGIDEGLLIGNLTMLSDAYGRIHREVTIQTKIKADGVRPDGSFGQHTGLIYNGNYGKDYLNDVLDLEITAAETPYAATNASITAMETLFGGDRWMVYENSETGVQHWDTSVVPRFIMFPVIDGQATASMNINLTKTEILGELWNSDVLEDFASALSKEAGDGNAGDLVGDRVFYDNDYMVHRGEDYVSSLRMYSSRTLNTECVNVQNLLGFHLSDGTRYTYVSGAEYEDIFAAWDWNLIPGITTDYGATPLNCAQASWTGIEPFVGGVTTGKTGIGVMKYTNPFTYSLRFQKAWFFLKGDREHVMIPVIESNSSTPIFSVLDQKKHNGPVLVDGKDVSKHSDWNKNGSVHRAPKSLWHDNMGYVFSQSISSLLGSNLVVKVGERFGNWSTIGTSTQPPYTVDLFVAYLDHTEIFSDVFSPVSYTTFPSISSGKFKSMLKHDDPTGIIELRNDAFVSAIYDTQHDLLYAVYWNTAGGVAGFFCPDNTPAAVYSSGNLAIIVDVKHGDITVSDPSQTLISASVTVQGRCFGQPKRVDFNLPTGPDVGKSMVKNIRRDSKSIV